MVNVYLRMAIEVICNFDLFLWFGCFVGFHCWKYCGVVLFA